MHTLETGAHPLHKKVFKVAQHNMEYSKEQGIMEKPTGATKISVLAL